jgi:UDP-N-acetylmuramate--alanine ligase
MTAGQVKYVYLLGAGGIGMSALGRYFLKRGAVVFGYDKTETEFTQRLQAEGMHLVYEDDPETVPSEIQSGNAENTLLIYTPAVPMDSRIRQYLTTLKLPFYKRAEVLGLLSKGHATYAVAGTHGKTTTSTLVAHILVEAGEKPVAFLGGISANYDTNYLEGDAQSPLVAEADEYDRSFLQLHPSYSVITSTDADHLDIYGDAAALKEGFVQFARQTSKEGLLFIHDGIEVPEDIDRRAVRYSASGKAAVYADNITLNGDCYRFDLCVGDKRLSNCELGMPGRHNLENAVAAAGICYMSGISEDSIRKALGTFRGVKRRFEYIIRTKDQIFIDDYAHHPAELRACIESVRALYPSKRITGVFQPHLFSRTRDFMAGFAESLSLLDELILLEIYPAREVPIPGISSEALLRLINKIPAQLCAKQELTERIRECNPEVLLTLGAGDIDAWVQPIKNILEGERL